MENQTTTFLYVLISIIVVYYITTRYIWCDEQENFDPSLVPVSSIVTLAKVAQKLVDGNGTLTNPGNLNVNGSLNIGTTRALPGGGWAASGNLNVQNGIISNGASAGIYFADRSGSSNYGVWSSNMVGTTVWNVFGTNQNVNIIQIENSGTYVGINTNSSITGKGTSGVPALNITQPDPKGDPAKNIGINAGGTDIKTTGVISASTIIANSGATINGNAQVNGGITATADSSFGPHLTVHGDMKARNYYGENNGPVIVGYNDIDGAPGLKVWGNAEITKNLTVTGNATINGNIKAGSLTIGGTTITEQHLQMLTGAHNVQLYMNDGSYGGPLTVSGGWDGAGHYARWGAGNGYDLKISMKPV